LIVLSTIPGSIVDIFPCELVPVVRVLNQSTSPNLNVSFDKVVEYFVRLILLVDLTPGKPKFFRATIGGDYLLIRNEDLRVEENEVNGEIQDDLAQENQVLADGGNQPEDVKEILKQISSVFKDDKNYVESEVLANDQARYQPYATQKGLRPVKKSESKWEDRLRRREPEEQPQEPLPMNEEPYISEEPTVTRSKYRRGPSRVDNLEPYNVVQDLLNTKSSVTIGQMLKYPNQRRNLAQALRRSRLPGQTTRLAISHVGEHQLSKPDDESDDEDLFDELEFEDELLEEAESYYTSEASLEEELHVNPWDGTQSCAAIEEVLVGHYDEENEEKKELSEIWQKALDELVVQEEIGNKGREQAEWLFA
ncbi:7836_t:CDS:2, partial [Dentiscutata heterogama]